ncbi:hypothetical protein CLI64_14755 [Nostoc sp. CENA543]|uniref:hypothetical protein n=1 Tax=Nostoc sp. CENA543 TaxID=1869241 RepID=UPI000CA36341|nr:hypothetical protein [Nostoc sp. CENA543]AUT01546.1 hypothetical protein CLI64_14755 [Nostoc sp. CENA543]
MLTNENIPSGFKVLCAEPELRIKYSAQPSCCLILFFMPFICLFIGQVLLLFTELYEAFNQGIIQAIYQIWQKIIKHWTFGFSLFLFGGITFYAIWINFGKIEFIANNDSLIVIESLFGISKRQEVSRANIQYLQQLQNDPYESPSWNLELVTNKKRGNLDISWFPKLTESEINRIIYHKIVLMEQQTFERIDWLSNVLADFYKIRIRP